MKTWHQFVENKINWQLLQQQQQQMQQPGNTHVNPREHDIAVLHRTVRGLKTQQAQQLTQQIIQTLSQSG